MERVSISNNRPVVKVVPIRTRHPAKEVSADVRGKATYEEDLLAPITEEWSET